MAESPQSLLGRAGLTCPLSAQMLLIWWERGLVAALGLSVALLGIGPLPIFPAGHAIDAERLSQATFYSWLTLKFVLWAHDGWAATRLAGLRSLAPLYLFFAAVAVPALIDFSWDGNYRNLLFGCLHAVMLVDLFFTAQRKRLLLWLMGVLPFVLVARGLAYDSSILNFDISHRLGLPLLHPVTAGYLFAMSIPLCLVCATEKPHLWRSLGLLSFTSQILGLILTFSRGAWLAWVASMVYFVAAAKKWKTLAAFGAIAALSALVFPTIQNRIATIARPQDDPSLRDRLQLLRVVVQLGMENPVFGVGYGREGFKKAIRARFQGTALEGRPYGHAHNVYVEIFARTGIVGLLSFLWLIGLTVCRVSRTARQRNGAERLLGFAIAASWIAAVVAGLGEIPFYHHQTRLFFFSLCALAHGYSFSAETVRCAFRGSASMRHS